MHLCIDHFDASWKTVSQYPAGFPFENRHQDLTKLGVPIIQMQRAGQLALQASSDQLHLGSMADTDDKAKRTEDFLRQHMIGQPVCARYLEKVWRGIPICGAFIHVQTPSSTYHLK